MKYWRAARLPLVPGAIGFGEKLLGSVERASEMPRVTSGMFVPASALAPPSSVTAQPPTKPNTWLLRRAVSERCTPVSRRSSAVDSSTSRPHTPPVELR